MGVGKRNSAGAWREAVALGGERRAPVPGAGGSGKGRGRRRDGFCPSPSRGPDRRRDGDLRRRLYGGKTGDVTTSGVKTPLCREIRVFRNSVLLLRFRVVTELSAGAVATDLREEGAMSRTRPVRPIIGSVSQNKCRNNERLIL